MVWGLDSRRYPEGLVLVSIQNPVRIGDYDEPEPDVALLQPRADDYGAAKATPADILLLVEVSDRTLRTDLGRKARIYASANVAEYWVIDLNNHALYGHRSPSTGGYTARHVLSGSEPISAEFAPSIEFTVGELLG